MSEKVRVGLIGAGFVSDVHAQAFTQYVKNVEVVGVASRTQEKAAGFAAEHGIAHAYGDYRALLDRPDIDVVTVAIPNDLHCQVPISFPQAALGAEIEVPTLDGPDHLMVPRGTQSGEVLKLRGRGMPDISGLFGN